MPRLHKHNDTDYPEYISPSQKHVDDQFVDFQSLVALVCKNFGWSINNVHIEKRIFEAINRVDQRKLHYKMYREGMVLGEINEAAILCYWLIRYRPVRFKDGVKEKHDNLNEIVAMFTLIYAINNFRKEKEKSDKDFSPLINDLLYAFTHRNMTFDSMTLLAQAMAV